MGAEVDYGIGTDDTTVHGRRAHSRSPGGRTPALIEALLDAIVRRLRLVLATYTVALLVITLAPLPGPAYPPTGLDKPVHFLLFGGLAALLYGNFVGGRRIPALVASVIGSVSVAALVELLQGLLPYRHEDIWDLVAGAVGALLAAFLIGWPRRGPR